MKTIVYALGRRLIGIAMIAVLGCLLSACLVRFAPGFGMDERELDSRLSNASRESIRASHRLESLPSYYGHYLWGALQGDFGY
jgi:ABC-type dipeptide/oligopeptide/nickel transport system permease component